jgi:hypothetical protein
MVYVEVERMVEVVYLAAATEVLVAAGVEVACPSAAATGQ